MSGRLFLILSAVIAIFGIFSWNVINRMSIEAIGMAIGMTLGVVAGIPTTALIVLASRRDAEDGYREDGEYYPRTVDQYQQSQYPQPAYTPVAFQDSPVVPWRSAPTPAPICQEDVTPYYNVVRRLLGDEPLDRRAPMLAPPNSPDYSAVTGGYPKPRARSLTSGLLHVVFAQPVIRKFCIIPVSSWGRMWQW